jgi:thiamine-phosphate diphosphorylase
VSTLPRPCVYLVTDRRRLAPDARTTRDEILALETWLDDALVAGVDVVQVRERDLDGGPLRDLTARLRDRARAGRTRILVNDRADVAAAAGAHGVHLRADSAPVDRVRTLGPDDWIVGRSVHTAAEARAAGTAGADYVLFGTMFGGGTKGDPARVAGIDALTETVRATPAPVIAIGGIDPVRAAFCIAAGAAGVAAISIFLPEGRAPLAMGVARAVDALRQAMTSRPHPNGKPR